MIDKEKIEKLEKENEMLKVTISDLVKEMLMLRNRIVNRGIDIGMITK